MGTEVGRKYSKEYHRGLEEALTQKGGAVNCKCRYAEDKNLAKIKHWKMAKNFLEVAPSFRAILKVGLWREGKV